ncbi:hypothetical protein [Aliihoeflea sp. PC F10.4]
MSDAPLSEAANLRRYQMLKGGILWLMGVPLIVVILLVMFVF